MPGQPQTGPIILHILMWTAFACALIAVMVVFMLNA